MHISIIGTGYVGLVQGACFADAGNYVICMDVDKKKIQKLRKGIIQIYEPGLEEIVKRNLKNGRLEFTSELKTAVNNSEIIFLCLPTPQAKDGSADVTSVIKVCEDMCKWIDGEKIVVSKSTVPVGTVDKLQEIFNKNAGHDVLVVSNPEFLKEGSALQDSLKPDRIIIGTSNKKAEKIIKGLYEPFVRTGNPIIVMDERSAELTKYAANAFLATKITFMNDLANLCEKAGADIELIRMGIGSDPRIAKHFLFAGIGYGGSCFPKDVKALVKMSEDYGQKLSLLRAVEQVNERQITLFVNKVKKHFLGNLKNKIIAVWGLSFKPMTDDVREAPSIKIIRMLLKESVKIKANDPVAMRNAKKVLGSKVKFCNSAYYALKDADALIIATEWNEFRTPDFKLMKELMRGNVIFDGRNIYDQKEVEKAGFVYYGVGRGVH